MKKEIGKKLLSIMLTLTLVFTMMPMIPGAVSKAHAEELTKISSLEATSNFADKMKVGKTAGTPAIPPFSAGIPAEKRLFSRRDFYRKGKGWSG